jgi:hypothetical protein
MLRTLSHLAPFGCIVLILAFAFEPFIQNLVHYRSIQSQDPLDVALLANTSIYKTHGPNIGSSRAYHERVALIIHL